MEERPERRRGRPRIAERRSSVSTWLPISLHDRLIAKANRNDISVSAMLRRLVSRQLPK